MFKLLHVEILIIEQLILLEHHFLDLQTLWDFH